MATMRAHPGTAGGRGGLRGSRQSERAREPARGTVASIMSGLHPSVWSGSSRPESRVGADASRAEVAAAFLATGGVLLVVVNPHTKEPLGLVLRRDIVRLRRRR